MGGVNPSHDVELERTARLMLSEWSEAGDRALGARVRERGAHAVVEEILAGHSPLPASTGIAARVAATTTYAEAVNRWVEPA